MNVRFEHIAIAVHEEDYAAWDHLLRVDLGGIEGMGEDAAARSAISPRNQSLFQ